VIFTTNVGEMGPVRAKKKIGRWGTGKGGKETYNGESSPTSCSDELTKKERQDIGRRKDGSPGSMEKMGYDSLVAKLIRTGAY